MITVLAIVACILLFSFAIFIHEFGHFLAAKLLGFQVDTFSIGFGPALWKKKIKGVEYRISAIPFGGYVALPQLDPAGTAGVQGSNTECNAAGGAPVAPMANWKKIVVAFAGPFGNIVLAVVLAFLLASASNARFGETPARIGAKIDRSADLGALQEGDLVLSVNGNPVKTWTEFQTEALIAGERTVRFEVERDGTNAVLSVTPRLFFDKSMEKCLIEPYAEHTTEIDDLVKDGPADQAGVKVGDRVLSVGDTPVKTWRELKKAVQVAGAHETRFVVERGGTNVVLSVTPQLDKETGACLIKAVSHAKAKYIAPWMPDRSPFRQLAWDLGSMARVLKALVTPKESRATAKSLGGPVMIAEGLYHQVRHDSWDAIGFLRFLNVNLAVLNLLPIPVLDGGLILFSLIALIFRRPVPRKIVDGLSMVFMYLFLALMIMLVWRDVARSRRRHKAVAEREKQILLEVRQRIRAEQFKPAFNLGTLPEPAGGARPPDAPSEK